MVPYWMSIFHFTVRITSKSLPLDVYAAHQKGTYPNFPQRPLSDIVQYAAVLVQLSERYIKEKQTELETESK